MRHLRKVFLFLCMMFAVSVNSYASGNQKKEMNESTKDENVESNPSKWGKIMNAIIQVESCGDQNARRGNSLGILQITPILVRECNDILKRKGSKKKYTLSDRLNVKKSKEMFILIMNQYNKAGSANAACRIWNSGINSKSVNHGYWKKFLKFYKG